MSKKDLAYADGYYDGLRHGKQMVVRRENMENDLTESQKAFDSIFRHEQNGLNGTEQEITVYKQSAWRWFRLGRISLRKDVGKKLLSQLKDFEDSFDDL